MAAWEDFTGLDWLSGEVVRPGATYWRVRGPVQGAGAVSGARLESLAQFIRPSHPGEDGPSAVRGWAALGSVWLGRVVANNVRWVELLTDGGVPLFMRRGKADSETDAFLEPVSSLSQALAEPGYVLQDVAMPSGAVAATTRLVFGPDALATAVTSGDGTNPQDACWSWWKVVVHHVYVRTKPDMGAMDTGTVQRGRIVLARPSKDPNWLVVFALGHPGLFMMVRQHEQDGTSTQLMEPVTDPVEVLGSSTAIHHPWSLDMSFGGAFDAQAAPKEVARILYEQVMPPELGAQVLDVQEVTNISQLHRTFKVSSEGMHGKHTDYLKCDKSTSRSKRAAGRPELPHLLHKARIAAAARVLASRGLVPRLRAEGPRFKVEADAGKVLSEHKIGKEPWTMKTLAKHFASMHQCDTSFFNEWRQLIRAELPWMKDLSDGSYAWWFASRKGVLERLPEDKIHAWANLPEAEPTSMAGRRVVLCHGDVSPSNVTVAPNGKLQSIDPEWACVTYSPLDASRAILTGVIKTRQDLRDFVRHYLEATGFEATEGAIDDYILDIRVMRLMGHYYDELTGKSPKVSIAVMRSTIALARKGGSRFALGLRKLISTEGLTPAAKAMRDGRLPHQASEGGVPRSLLEQQPTQRRRRGRSPEPKPADDKRQEQSAAEEPRAEWWNQVPLTGPPAAAEEDVWSWRLETVHGSPGFGGGLNEGSQIFMQPFVSSKVIGYLPYGAVVQGRAIAVQGWVELFLEGGLAPGRHAYARRLARETHMLSGLVRQEKPAEKLQAEPCAFVECLMSPAACAATQLLMTPPHERDRSPVLNPPDKPTWWCTTQRVVVRSQKYGDAENAMGVVHAHKAVLAKGPDRQKWVELVVPGGPDLYMLTHKPDAQEPHLMRPARGFADVLGSTDCIDTPWSVDRVMGGGEAATDAMEAAYRLASEAIFGSACKEALLLDEVHDTTKDQHLPFPPQKRTFSIERINNGEHYMMQIDKPRSSAGRRKVRPLPQVLCKARHMEAVRLFSEQDLGPTLLAEHVGWHLEALGKLKKDENKLKMREVGQHLAKIAALPTEWFEKYRCAIREHLPWMSQVGDGSHVWRHTGNKDAFIAVGSKDWSSEDFNAWAMSGEFQPRSPAARTLVTCHGDACPENFVRTSSGRPKSINLNFACVTCAVEDISRALHTFVKGAAKKGNLLRVYNDKFALVHAYLVARDLPAGDREVDDFIVDAQCWRLSDVMLRGRSNLQDIRQAVRFARAGSSDFAMRLRRLILCHTLDAAGECWRKHLGKSSIGAQLAPVPRKPEPEPEPKRGRSQKRASRRKQHERAQTVPARQEGIEEKWDRNMLALEAERHAADERVEARRWSVATARFRSSSANMRYDASPPPWSRSRSPVPAEDNSWPDQRNLKALLKNGDEIFLDVGWASALSLLLAQQEAVARPERLQQAMEAALDMRPSLVTRVNLGSGRTWIVVGGGQSRLGIIARKDQNVDSPVLNAKLTTGTIVEQMDLQGDRLKFRRLRGEGPDFGWASIRTRTTDLLMPLFPPGMLNEPDLAEGKALEDAPASEGIASAAV